QQLDAVVAATTGHASDCSAALEQIRETRGLWSRTGEAIRAQNAPAELVRRVDATLGELLRTDERIVALRDRLLAVQGEATRQLGLCDEMLEKLDQSSHAEERGFGERSAPPIWQAGSQRGGVESLAPLLTEGRIEGRLTQGFIARHPSVALIPLLLFPVLALLMRHARSRATHWTEANPEIREHLAVLELPYSVALILTGFSLVTLHPTSPRLLADLVAAVLLVPGLRVLGRIVPSVLMPPIYGLAALRVVDWLQDFIQPAPILGQALLCLSMAAGLLFMIWSVRSAVARGTPSTPREQRWFAGVLWTGRLLAVAFGIACVAAVLGYVGLARFISSTLLVIPTAFLGCFVVARILLGLCELSLEVRPLAGLYMVRNHRPLISNRSGAMISLLAVAGWLFTIRSNLSKLGLEMDLLRRVGTLSLSFGSVTFSVRDLFLCAVTLGASAVLSRLVRFVLDEELFPRLRLAHGLSYALASLIQYAILTIGFLLALATLGFDASRLTVMIGALGVGIGFGLQAIVNNFVSGLILLFERPIKTGDTVQVGQVTGEVRRIGVRSSTVRTASGAEVIVPNSTLVSDSVTNWTLSDRSRRFEIPIGVAYGTKPATVLTMLKELAKQHPEVLAHPEPGAFFLGFGDSALNFELRAWVGDGGRVGAVKSEVAVAVAEAFEAAGILKKV
ncbi:MAG TPA: mechanosensitive ion channel domain-containing protein, partial [Myxococcota bacterium]|nr:mechanosensitive ion channel domain-containing protein [Myxococcota bacterium]